MGQTLLQPNEINISNYCEAVSRFCSVLPQKEHDAHMALGVADEYFEIMEAFDNCDETGIKEESGDMFWYIALFCEKNDISFERLIDEMFVEVNRDNVKGQLTTTPRISEFIYYCKARLAGYTKSFTSAQVRQFAKESVALVFATVGATFGLEALEDATVIVEILQKNYAKLSNRHGITFNPDNGQTRDTAAEREILEK